MKKIAILLAGLVLMLSGCKFIRIGDLSNFNFISGDGPLVTKTFEPGMYDVITSSISADVIYDGVSDHPSIEVTAPENLFEYFDFVVEEGTLILRYKKDAHVVHDGNVVIHVTAVNLRKVAMAGSGSFRMEAPVTVAKFEGAIAGSGDMLLDRITAPSVTLAVAGSGNMTVSKLDCVDLAASVAGSGDMRIAGKAGTATVSIAGSGDIDIRALESDDVQTSALGSGAIRR